MGIKTKALADASLEEKRDFLTKFLQIPVEAGEDETAMTAKIEAAQPGNENIFVQEPDTPEEVAASEVSPQPAPLPEERAGRQTGTLGQGDPRAVIFIPVVDTEDGSGAKDVMVGVNGRAWQLQRGVDLNVPWRVVVALENAISDIVRHSQEPESLGEVTVRAAKRFNYNFVEKPSDDEIAAWNEKIAAQFCA